MRFSRPCLSSLFATTVPFLSRSSRSASLAKNLAQFHPTIAQTWITAACNKLLQPQHVLPSSRKLAWWRCPYCEHQHPKRIDLHVAAGGACPKCSRMPTLTCSRKRSASSSRTSDNTLAATVKHRCRPDNSLAILDAPNASRVKNSIADNGYLRVSETRNLLPMLARNYDKEVKRISNDEQLFVSPKLDGVRCVVAWNLRDRCLSFFSRSGMLFDCCDHIEPQLRPLFEKDNMLVLDGELYNHDASDFEQLTSAIRTTRQHRTAGIEKVQQQLQYHVFDLLYAKEFPHMTVVPFGQRYKHLCDLMQKINSGKGQGRRKVVKLVPVMSAKKSDIDRLLRLNVDRGYEGIMIRRNGIEDNKCITSVSSSGGASAAVPGYAYGARSPNLLKYKLMQDSEYIIVDGVEGKGKWRGCLGAFVCQTRAGHRFTVAPATTEERKREMWHRLNVYKGKMLTVQYQELSTNGVPRFPIGKCVRGTKTGSDWV
ncbi:mitochondrial DNA ligase homolog, LIG k-alpha [Trypanosoma equiperdum]|uniref:Mitochondrial DNA ligase homolog, LIG k-alpha n=1 Tax=Trypanosoma equiperdum TaxID=5694 RepID=A0A1G4I2P8_TRYEQ|nr:mitochondrial DNA ligase homolog, LIG k-alpha [Trypanosoma equiperdum]